MARAGAGWNGGRCADRKVRGAARAPQLGDRVRKAIPIHQTAGSNPRLWPHGQSQSRHPAASQRKEKGSSDFVADFVI